MSDRQRTFARLVVLDADKGDAVDHLPERVAGEVEAVLLEILREVGERLELQHVGAAASVRIIRARRTSLSL